MRIVFRTDASSQIGTGHIMRCLTLADALREQGGKCQFVCREHQGHLIEYTRSRGYRVHALPKPWEQTSFEYDLDHAHWLGVDWKTDAEQTRQALDSEVLDWLIVDHYALDHRWELSLRSATKRIMAIDDLADRRHDCDLLLDQNYGSSAYRYRALVPPGTKQRFGPEYALLKPVYAEQRAQLPARNGQVFRVLIYFGGGADAKNLTSMAVQAFEAPELAHIELDIVVGTAYAHLPVLKNLVAQRGKATIHRQLPDLAGLMAAADIAIGAGGATTWERCCLGLPSILVVCAHNQEEIGQAIGKLGAAVVLYPNKKLTSEIQEQIASLSSDDNKYLQMSHRAGRICDGLGVSRVSKEIISTSKTIAYAR
jgi:UDP-2,4-diacetamido-2,4,6-trideoxy-beta-L-altropyranose hydrolase